MEYFGTTLKQMVAKASTPQEAPIQMIFIVFPTPSIASIAATRPVYPSVLRALPINEKMDWF